MPDLLKTLYQQQLVMVCGTGGVGKTSISAALAIRLAKQGSRVGLLTIDPAKRLAAALGLENLASDPKLLNPILRQNHGLVLRGEVSALMYDPKDTLDEFVGTTGGPQLLAKMKTNNIYNIIASSFSGTHEYLALTKLHQLHHQYDFDTIILDTPPARHTLDFLDAPERLANFFDDRVLQWFLPNPRSKSFFERLRAHGTRGALALLEKVTGNGVLSDFLEISPHLATLKTEFLRRQEDIQDLLRSRAAGVLYVSTPLIIGGREFSVFRRDAKARKLQTLGLVLNRSLKNSIGPVPKGSERAGSPLAVQKNLELLEALIGREEANTQTLVKNLKFPFVTLPELSQTEDPLKAILELGDGLEDQH